MPTVFLKDVDGCDEPQVWVLPQATPLLILRNQVFRCICKADNGPDGDELVYFYEPAER